jgi:hypothetical protein
LFFKGVLNLVKVMCFEQPSFPSKLVQWAEIWCLLTTSGGTGTFGFVKWLKILLETKLVFIIVRQSTEIGVEFLFGEIRLLNWVILVGSVYGPPNSSIVYRTLESGDYGLEAFESVCSEVLSLYGEVFILEDFNVDLLDPGHVLFVPFSDLLKTFMLHNVAILPTRRVTGKLLDLFLVSVPVCVNDF